jgi:hypothetical protein
MSLRASITTEQMRFFAFLLREFLADAENAEGRRLSTLPSYTRLIRSACATGFVFDGADYEEGASLTKIVHEDPTALATLPFTRLRQYVHYMIRAERWDDQNDSEAGGAIHTAFTNGHLRRLADRLESE